MSVNYNMMYIYYYEDIYGDIYIYILTVNIYVYIECGDIYLVGGLEHGFYFSIYWELLGIMIPID